MACEAAASDARRAEGAVGRAARGRLFEVGWTPLERSMEGALKMADRLGGTVRGARDAWVTPRGAWLAGRLAWAGRRGRACRQGLDEGLGRVAGQKGDQYSQLRLFGPLR